MSSRIVVRVESSEVATLVSLGTRYCEREELKTREMLIFGRVKWENKAGNCSARVAPSCHLSSQKAVVVPFPMVTTEWRQKGVRVDIISFQMGVSREWGSPTSRRVDHP